LLKTIKIYDNFQRIAMTLLPNSCTHSGFNTKRKHVERFQQDWGEKTRFS